MHDLSIAGLYTMFKRNYERSLDPTVSHVHVRINLVKS